MGFFDNFDPDAKSFAFMQAGANMLNASSNSRTPVSMGNVLGQGMSGAVDGAKVAIEQKAELQRQQATHTQAMAQLKIKHSIENTDDAQKAAGGISVLRDTVKQNPAFASVPGVSALLAPDAHAQIGSKAVLDALQNVAKLMYVPSAKLTPQADADGNPGAMNPETNQWYPQGQNPSSTQVPTQAVPLAQQAIQNQGQSQGSTAPVASTNIPARPQPVPVPQAAAIPNLTGFGVQLATSAPVTSTNAPVAETPAMPVPAPDFTRSPGESPIAYKARMEEQSKLRDDVRGVNNAVVQKKAINTVETQQAQHAADVKALADDPTKQAGFESIANNIALTGQSLDAVKKKYGDHWYTNNSHFYDQAKAFDTDVSNLYTDNGKTMVEYIKQLKAAGIAPTQMMNTESEYQRAQQAITGDGPVDSRIAAQHRMQLALKADLAEAESYRKAAAGRLGVDYKPLIDPSILPGEATITGNTGSHRIGDTIQAPNGQKYSIIGKNKMSKVD